MQFLSDSLNIDPSGTFGTIQPLEADVESVTAQNELRAVFSCIDLTSLEATDNAVSIDALCDKALACRDLVQDLPLPAALCVYPPFVRQVRGRLQGTGIAVASVAGAFPSGQACLQLKLDEVKYALDQGADELDVVINRGAFLAGSFNEVFDELTRIREVAAGAVLKIILETGELQSVQNICRASEIALKSGADFIKTSTGKASAGAGPLAANAMLLTLMLWFERTGKMKGIKVSGGIREIKDACYYFELAKPLIDPGSPKSTFRIGASKLADHLLLAMHRHGI